MARSPKKRGPGRPPLGHAARSKLIQCKVTEAELERVTELAERAELTVSEYVRRQILDPV